MSMFIDSASGLAVSDPEIRPFSAAGSGVSAEEMAQALKPMILSASGWRKVFAADGDEESTTSEITQADALLAAAMAEVYCDFLLSRCNKDMPVVVVGLDARHTGPALADVMLRTLLGRDVEIRYLFIAGA
ncbi:MAG: phosphoglucomutase, partial [Spirochaetales bacterium]|nr:phosphoglucomutase [Spirochaetales bacterium]